MTLPPIVSALPALLGRWYIRLLFVLVVLIAAVLPLVVLTFWLDL